MRILIVVIFVWFLTPSSFAQERTVGLLSYDAEKSFDGYTLLFPHGDSKAYLINNCGELVHEWDRVSPYLPGNSAYLTEDGTLIRCIRHFDRNSDPIWAGGGGAIVEARDWDGNLLWSFEQNDSLRRIHHDIEIMPNGNVLMISWEKKSLEECIAQGRDPNNISHGNLLPDYILEYNPILDSVVWEWHVWDHLIQDFDMTKENFGPVYQNPGKVNINYENNLGNSDWLHTNAIDYNPDLDQIILSVPHFDEVWIIDHSTTTEEAATNEGGKAGKGGELLFRWGNPRAHQAGDTIDQMLFFQHDIQWMNDFIDPSDPLYNQLLVFNNRFSEEFSVVNVIEPVFQDDSLNYKIEDLAFLPKDYVMTKQHPQKEELHSTGLSGAQLLPNGNFLILSGRFGYVFELTSDNEIVWEYKVPLTNGLAVEQGTELGINDNINFRVKKYPLDYGAFEGRDLTPKGTLQIEEGDALCARVVNTEDVIEKIAFEMYPNPVDNQLNIELQSSGEKLRIYDLTGRKIHETTLSAGLNRVDVSSFMTGAYMIQVGQHSNKKLIKID